MHYRACYYPKTGFPHDHMYKLIFETDLVPNIPSDPWCLRAIDSNNIFIEANDDNTDVVDTIQQLDCLKIQASNHLSRKATAYFKAHTSPDWRLGNVEIVAIDMRPRAQSRSVPVKGRFMGRGLVRLYANNEEINEEAVHDTVSGNAGKDPTKCSFRKDQTDGTVLSILALPSYMTPADLVGFVGHSDEISHIRMIRTGVPNRYMVLMKFRDSSQAKAFQHQYNGKLFNSMDPETCQVVFVSAIQFRSQARQSDDIPYLLEDPFTADEESQDEDQKLANEIPVLPRPPAPPLPPLRELPTCPVCLERMDASITGLLTIVCQHTFHCSCLTKWGDGSCPVCRYSQRAGAKPPGTSKCNVCESEANLWICLICGHIGCGRYDQAHAYDHYIATSHCYAMDIDSQRVWDYASDGYVHRLLQNQADGKLVELPGASSSGQTDSAEKKSQADDDISLQYSYLMSSQLESQREYYEDILNSAADRTQHAVERAEKAEKLVQDLQAQLKEAAANHQKVMLLEKELEKATSKADKLQVLCHELERKYKEESSISKGMIAVMEKYKREKSEQDIQFVKLREEIAELREQGRDLMLFLDAKEKLQGAGADVQQGTVEVGPSPSAKLKLRRKK